MLSLEERIRPLIVDWFKEQDERHGSEDWTELSDLNNEAAGIARAALKELDKELTRKELAVTDEWYLDDCENTRELIQDMLGMDYAGFLECLSDEPNTKEARLNGMNKWLSPLCVVKAVDVREKDGCLEWKFKIKE